MSGAAASPMLVVLGRIDVHPEDAGAAGALAAALAEETRKEPGCLQYAIGQDIAQPGRFWLSEKWRNAEALRAHFRTSYMAAFRAELRALRDVRVTASSYEVGTETDLMKR